MAREETEKLTQILWGVALSRAVCTIGELGIADQIQAGSPQSVETLAPEQREPMSVRSIEYCAS
jgi:hypothetical protein